MTTPIVCRCARCKKETEVFGSRWCSACYYPGIDQDWQRFEMLIEEGYTRHQARLMAGLSDPEE